MASPFTIGTNTTFPNTNAGAGTDVLVSLQTGEAKGLGTITSGANDADVWINPIKVKTVAAGGFAAGDFLEIYVTISEDDGDWSNGYDPDTTTDLGSGVQSLILCDVVEMSADNTDYRTRGFNLLDKIGGVVVPKYWGLIVFLNSAGVSADLSATGTDHTAEYLVSTWT